MKEASSGERNSLTKNYSPGVFFRELKELTTSDLNMMSLQWREHEILSEKEDIEAMPTNEIRTIVREPQTDSGEKYSQYDYDEDWEVLLYLQQLMLRERERFVWHKEQPGL